MTDLCSCDGSWSNLGQTDCLGEAGELTGAFIAPYLVNGVKQCIAKADTLNSDYFNATTTGKVVAENIAERWLHLLNIVKVTPIVEDDIIDSSNPLQDRKVNNGKRGYTFFIATDEPHKLAKKFATLECKNLGFFGTTDNNNIVGVSSGEDLCMRKVSFLSTKVNEKSTLNSTGAELEITITFANSERDELVDYVKPESDVILDDLDSLIDVDASIISASVNTVVFTLPTCYGAKNNRILAKGLTNAEIEVYNVTDATAPALTSLTESNGTYTATFTVAQDVADVVRIQGVGGVTVQGTYDLKNAPNTTLAIS